MFGQKNFSGLRRLHKTILYRFYITKLTITPFVVFDYGFKKFPLVEFVWARSNFNQIALFLQSEVSYPGFVFYPLAYIIRDYKAFGNQLLPLKYIPINFLISYIFNKKNINMIYSKSSGSNSIKKKHLKKNKLTYVELPSKVLKLFSINTFAVTTTTRNLLLNKIVEGGWGFFKTAKKLIHVRGVAKNPVDHPNGGRTKSKQPELSPWGWIAKKTK